MKSDSVQSKQILKEFDIVLNVPHTWPITDHDLISQGISSLFAGSHGCHGPILCWSCHHDLQTNYIVVVIIKNHLTFLQLKHYITAHYCSCLPLASNSPLTCQLPNPPKKAGNLFPFLFLGPKKATGSSFFSLNFDNCYITLVV